MTVSPTEALSAGRESLLKYHPMSGSIRTATFAVVDVETTGTDPSIDAVVEVAVLRMRGGKTIDRFSSLVNPGRPIPARAAAIHHISDEMVAEKPTLVELTPILRERTDDSVIVAHNAPFDLSFLPMLAGRPAVCTLRLARHLVPELPTFRLQALRDSLHLPSASSPADAHRAFADTDLTATLFLELLARYSERCRGSDDLDALIALSAAPIAYRSFPFGKHRNVNLDAVPPDYLEWILRTENPPFDRDIRYSAEAELARRRAADPLVHTT
jgi:DNA polymerase III epsilon subunit family exonuclease